MPYVPYVVDNTGREERVYDIYSRLLKERIIFLGTQVNAEIANSLVDSFQKRAAAVYG